MDHDEAAPVPDDSLVTWYNLGHEYDSFLAMLRRQYAAAQAQRASWRRTGKGPPPPLDAHALGGLIDMFSRADLSNFMRHQRVCALPARGAPVPLFEELFISIDDLHATIMPDRNIRANPWLFQHLTETLDRRILSFLIREEDRSVIADYSINLNVSSILSPEFLRFDASLIASARGTVVLEIQPIDIFADLEAFAFARDFAHDRGYRLCLDGMTTQSLSLIDRHALKIDLIKLIWSPDAVPLPDSPRHDRLLAQIEKAGPNSVILARVDTDQGIQFGRSLGLSQFQGRLIEKMSAPLPFQTERIAYR